LCFERCFSKQNSVICLNSHFGTPNLWAGCATGTGIILCQIPQKISPLATDFDENGSACRATHPEQNDTDLSKIRLAVAKIQEFENRLFL